MHTRLFNHVKNLLLPCLAFSILTGILSAILVTAFKIGAESVVNLSTFLYDAVRAKPIWIPLLILGSAILGLVASFILSFSHSCKGGGIPTSITAIRGVVSFHWLKGVFVLPFSSLLTFFCGIPLGTEGPCVQMGTAVGDGVVRCFGSKKQKCWRRYIMTGGASAGFSIATASPISAIIFSMEEIHKHFSPMLLTVASISVISAQITAQTLALFEIGSVGLFQISEYNALDPKLLFAPLLVGLICGSSSILFTRFYYFVDQLMRTILKKLSRRILFPILFASIALVGFFLSSALGSGHGLIEQLFESQIIWYLLILIFLVRMVIMMISNTAGVTGGIFLPTLTFGAIIGSLCADAMIALGWIDPEHYIVIVILGVTSFLSATSRIPVTACVFAVEALGGINNILPIVIAATVALLTVELSGLEDFSDTVIKSRIHSISQGKKPTVIQVPLTVNQDSFVVGKELRDILWPNSCAIVSFERAPDNRGKVGITEGDVIVVHYETYDPAVTAEEFQDLVGNQPTQIRRLMDPRSEESDLIENFQQ